MSHTALSTTRGVGNTVLYVLADGITGEHSGFWSKCGWVPAVYEELLTTLRADKSVQFTNSSKEKETLCFALPFKVTKILEVCIAHE